MTPIAKGWFIWINIIPIIVINSEIINWEISRGQEVVYIKY